jgi:hypothetical protein
LARRFDDQCGALLTHLMLWPPLVAVMQERWPVGQTHRNVDAFPIHAEQGVLAQAEYPAELYRRDAASHAKC